jgi:hypothetical protein
MALSRSAYRSQPSRHTRSRRTEIIVAMSILSLAAFFVVGCNDDTKTIRSIQAGRQLRQQSETKVDHLTEAFSLVSRLIELQAESAARQIVYHLNAWQQSAGETAADSEVPTDLLKTISDVIPLKQSTETVSRQTFAESDVDLLKLRYLLRQVVRSVRDGEVTDPLWAKWIDQNRQSLGDENADQLALATQLFDWTVRNVSLEPMTYNGSLPTPNLPLGLSFAGPGYRQTPLQTLFRGTGDALQRSGTFIGLCRQADLPACMLGIAPSANTSAGGSSSVARPWLVGVLIGGKVYLFDCGLGVPIVGPGQQGVATLDQARRDASVLRRMNVPGWFDYPFQKDDVQQCVAMLMVEPESISFRARRLQNSLTGDARMGVYDDPKALADSFVAVTGIASAQIWDIPLLSRIYAAAISQAASQDPMLAFYVFAPWTILDGEFEQAKRLALGRWRHLQGTLDSNEDEAIEGAKMLYLSQRQPEFEIAELRGDVELQKRYGIRRELGVEPEVYDRQVQQFQAILRQGKVLASYWLSLVQYDSGRYDLARNWFQDRILGDGLESDWDVAARYNLARSLEILGETEKAAALYRTEGDTQAHGNRIRARLITRETTDAAATPVTETPVTETPVTETPVTETPATETPVTETPVTQ